MEAQRITPVDGRDSSQLHGSSGTATPSRDDQRAGDDAARFQIRPERLDLVGAAADSQIQPGDQRRANPFHQPPSAGAKEVKSATPALRKARTRVSGGSQQDDQKAATQETQGE